MYAQRVQESTAVAGIEAFAARATAGVRRLSDTAFDLDFGAGASKVVVSIENAGEHLILSYVCTWAALPNASFAPSLLMKNHGGVGGSPFYFSVERADGHAVCHLETRQLLAGDSTAEEITRLLETLHASAPPRR